MTTVKLEKSVITNDWLEAFPHLKSYSPNKFYRNLGCVVLGIELVKIPRTNDYRPHFVLYSLCRNTVNECLDAPIVLQEFRDRKNFQLDIPFENHKSLFKEAVEIIKAQFPILVKDNVLVKDIISVIDNYSATKRFSIAPNSYFQGKFMQTKLEIELYSNGVNKAQEILTSIKKRDWDKEHFIACGVDLVEWMEDLKNKIYNQDLFLKKVKINQTDKKLAKIQV